MQRLRSLTHVTRFMLVWFVLSLGVAVASPVVKPDGLLLVCSGGVMKLVAPEGEDGAAPASHTLDCPLCASIGAPPAAMRASLDVPAVRATNPVDVQSAPSCGQSAAPPPARGPPAFA